jgi:hypothetical protein
MFGSILNVLPPEFETADMIYLESELTGNELEITLQGVGRRMVGLK